MQTLCEIPIVCRRLSDHRNCQFLKWVICAMTYRYAHVTATMQKESANRMEKFIAGL